MTARSSATVPAPQRAIVIGASITGLLAARVLSERYPEVLLLERDPLPNRAAPRKGTPHAIHPHGLLARGLQVIEDLFPGFTDALLAQGASTGDIGLGVALDTDRRRFARMPLGIAGLAASRLAIEGELRRRVHATGICRGVPAIFYLASDVRRQLEPHRLRAEHRRLELDQGVSRRGVAQRSRGIAPDLWDGSASLRVEFEPRKDARMGGRERRRGKV